MMGQPMGGGMAGQFGAAHSGPRGRSVVWEDGDSRSWHLLDEGPSLNQKVRKRTQYAPLIFVPIEW